MRTAVEQPGLDLGCGVPRGYAGMIPGHQGPQLVRRCLVALAAGCACPAVSWVFLYRCHGIGELTAAAVRHLPPPPPLAVAARPTHATLLSMPQALLRHIGEVIEPAVGPLRPLIDRLDPLVSPALAAVAPAVRRAAAATNASLADLEAWQLVLLTALATLLLARLWQGLRRALRTVQDKGACLLSWLLPCCYAAAQRPH